MSRKFALVIVGVILFAIFLLVGCVPSPPPPCELTTEKNTWKCLRRAGVPAEVRRNVTIVAPPQGGRELEVTALPLPAEQIPQPPSRKNITRLITIVIAPQVSIKGTNEIVVNFDPPLVMTMDFQSEDVKDVPRADGKPQLKIISFYKEGNEWRWEKWENTKVVCEAPCDQGTLTAEIKTLRPGDPEAEGF